MDLSREVGVVVTGALASKHVRKAIRILSPKFTVTATRRHKPDGRNSRNEVIVTVGSPNWEMRKVIKILQKAKEPFPVKRTLFKLYSKK